ncbi:hypothetical protein OIU79_009280 [Salix purpurea]|uniref:Uncharacterized protein n=1 Tax=Salix purpurea TaxID=77065 RepID=A0A9Q0TK96_SALPP|nr:hypothetical protein OIU79_009280 [Salix purpurea]
MDLQKELLIYKTCWVPLEMNTFNHHKLIEGRGVFKLEPVRNFVVEMIKMVRMFNMASPFDYLSRGESACDFVLYIQVFHDCGTSSIFLPGSDVPYFFYVRTESCQTTFSFAPKVLAGKSTKGLLWEYTPEFFGFPEASEDMLWLCHWKFKDWFKAGDAVQFSVAMAPHFQMKKCGIRPLYEQQDDVESNFWRNCPELFTDRDLTAFNSYSTRGTFAPASEGERAKNMRAAIIPTGKNRIINGGGGSGGKINGSTSIDAAKTVSIKTLTMLKHCTIFLL